MSVRDEGGRRRGPRRFPSPRPRPVPASAWPVTTPVTVRRPSGTTTRAPMTGSWQALGNGVGQRLELRHRHRDADVQHRAETGIRGQGRDERGTVPRSRALAVGGPTDRGLSSCLPTPRACSPGCAAGTRVERRNQLGAAVVEDPAAQPRDRILRLQQRLRRERAERDDHLRLRSSRSAGRGTARRSRLRPAPGCGCRAAGT